MGDVPGAYPRAVRCGGECSPPPASTARSWRARGWRANVDVVAVGSRDRARGEAFAAEHGIGRVHGSYEELLADPEVEAVYIPLPNSLHVPWSIKALEAGKHVLCEKPLTRRVGGGRGRLRRRRARRPAADGGVHVALPPADRGARATRAREIAPLRMVRAAFGFTLPPTTRPTCASQGELDGGALMDVGCYCVSALRLLGGEPERVQRRGRARRRAASTCASPACCGFAGRRARRVRLRPRRAAARRDRGRRRGRHAGRPRTRGTGSRRG